MIIAMMTPYIATASQKITEIKFLETKRGILTAEPTMLVPVMKIPLKEFISRHLPCCTNNRDAENHRETNKCVPLGVNAVYDISPPLVGAVHAHSNRAVVKRIAEVERYVGLWGNN